MFAYALTGIRKIRRTRTSRFVLAIDDLRIAQSEAVGLLGESGSGKSTLLDLLGMVVAPDEAESFSFLPLGHSEIRVDHLWRKAKLDALTGLRARHMGYVLQNGGLLPFLAVRDNINLSRRILGLAEDGTVEDLVRTLGIARVARQFPRTLSVGERQRVAIARSLAHRPTVILADEPTASLDPVNADRVLRLLLELARDQGATVIVATHDREVVRRLGLRPITHTVAETSDGTVVSTVRG